MAIRAQALVGQQVGTVVMEVTLMPMGVVVAATRLALIQLRELVASERLAGKDGPQAQRGRTELHPGFGICHLYASTCALEPAADFPPTKSQKPAHILSRLTSGHRHPDTTAVAQGRTRYAYLPDQRTKEEMAVLVTAGAAGLVGSIVLFDSVSAGVEMKLVEMQLGEVTALKLATGALLAEWEAVVPQVVPMVVGTGSRSCWRS